MKEYKVKIEGTWGIREKGKRGRKEEKYNDKITGKERMKYVEKDRRKKKKENGVKKENGPEKKTGKKNVFAGKVNGREERRKY